MTTLHLHGRVTLVTGPRGLTVRLSHANTRGLWALQSPHTPPRVVRGVRGSVRHAVQVATRYARRFC